MKWVYAVGGLALVAGGVTVWQSSGPQPAALSTAQPSVQLELEAYGGFAYIREPDTLNIAFLKTTNRPADNCHVEQLGTDLFVVSGNIEAPVGPTRKFDVGGAVVTFPGLAASGPLLETDRGARPYGRPARPHEEDQWHNLKWVAGISSGAPGTDYPESMLRPDWKSVIDGRVEIIRGSVRAAHPSDVAIQMAIFDFKRPADTSPAFAHAMTDRTVWTAEVPGDGVEIAITGGRGTVSSLVVKPTLPNRPVRLKLIGRHAHGVAPAMAEGDALSHFCAFYDLMPDSSRPAHAAQLVPHIKDLPVLGNGAGRPSPGPYCPGDWP
jgi:hypothetical protein